MVDYPKRVILVNKGPIIDLVKVYISNSNDPRGVDLIDESLLDLSSSKSVS